MANLDAPALKLELTPETAIGIVQKEVQRRGWKKFDLSDIITVYTPFYIFSFDVIAEGGAPPGKAALNANNGEINEFVPAIIERPIEKVKKTPDGMSVEVESTNIKQSEVEKVATIKIANMLGAKRENIVISAVSKIYIPFFRLWVDVAGDSFKIEIDGALGYPAGLDPIPKREKTWDESTAQAVEKMKSPSGIAQLFGQTVTEITKALGGKGDNKLVQWALIGAAIIIIGFFALQQFNANVQCKVNDEFLSRPEYFGLFGKQKIYPQEIEENVLYVAGTCSFSSRENDRLVIGQVELTKDRLPVASTTVNATTLANMPIIREFELEWPRDDYSGEYVLGFQKIVG